MPPSQKGKKLHLAPNQRGQIALVTSVDLVTQCDVRLCSNPHLCP